MSSRTTDTATVDRIGHTHNTAPTLFADVGGTRFTEQFNRYATDFVDR